MKITLNNDDGLSLEKLQEKIEEAENITEEHKKGFRKLIETVDIFNHSIKNLDDVRILVELMDEELPKAKKGDKKARMRVKAYKDELLSCLRSVAVTIGLSIFAGAGGVALAYTGYEIVLNSTGLTLASCTGGVMCILGCIVTALAVLAASIMVYAGVKTIYKLVVVRGGNPQRFEKV